MKKILMILATAGLLNFTSCKDFLTIVPSDAMFLEDVSSLKKTLGGYLYVYTRNSGKGTSNMAASWLPTYFSAKYTAYSDVWTFDSWLNSDLSDDDKRLLARAVINESDWGAYYDVIGLMNVILVQIDNVPGDEETRRYVKGEALVHRAHAFLKLLQLYCPMDDASMGVPVYLDIYGGFADADLSRRPQQEVFKCIIDDLTEAERLLGITNPKESYNIMFNANYIYRIKAQVYHWKASGPAAEEGDWAKAAEAARAAIASAADILPLTVAQLQPYLNLPFFSTPSLDVPEFLYTYNQQGGSSPEYGYKADLYNELYLDADTRKTTWFSVTGNPPNEIIESKKQGRSLLGNVLYYAFRLSEQYLILIEAYAHTDYDEGMQWLTKWQSVRYMAGQEADWPNPSNAEELLAEVIKERKREFVQEADHHWLDMKRFGATEDSRRTTNFVAAPLTANDTRYSFMIPDTETETNDLKQNPGWRSV